MSIQAVDIIKALDAYSTKLVVKVTVSPIVGPSINVGERFAVSVTAENATKANGGVDLANVSFEFMVTNWEVARFIVPAASVGLATPDLISDPPLTPGDEVERFTLFLYNQYSFFAPGSVRALPDVELIAAKAAPLGNNNVLCHVRYDFRDLVRQYWSPGSASFKVL
jgi:hypothetical protein